jgi:hypothetical protein
MSDVDRERHVPGKVRLGSTARAEETCSAGRSTERPAGSMIAVRLKISGSAGPGYGWREDTPARRNVQMEDSYVAE